MVYIPLFFLVLLVLAISVKCWPRSRRAEFDELYREWMDRCRQRGLTGRQALDEYQFRIAWVRFRRRMTEAVIAWPDGYQVKLQEIAIDEASCLAVYDKFVAKQFLAVVQGASHSDILYKPAMQALLDAKPVVHRRVNSDDEIAALRSS